MGTVALAKIVSNFNYYFIYILAFWQQVYFLLLGSKKQKDNKKEELPTTPKWLLVKTKS